MSNPNIVYMQPEYGPTGWYDITTGQPAESPNRQGMVDVGFVLDENGGASRVLKDANGKYYVGDPAGMNPPIPKDWTDAQAQQQIANGYAKDRELAAQQKASRNPIDKLVSDYGPAIIGGVFGGGALGLYDGVLGSAGTGGNGLFGGGGALSGDVGATSLNSIGGPATGAYGEAAGTSSLLGPFGSSVTSGAGAATDVMGAGAIGGTAAGTALGTDVAAAAAAAGVTPSVLSSLASTLGVSTSDLIKLGATAIGALAGATGANSKPAGTTTVTQDIPDWLKPYVIGNLNAAQDYMKTTPQDNSLLAPATAQMKSTINGDYLNANPFVDAMFNKAAGEVGANVDSRFTSAGRYGSGAHQGVLGTTFNKLATDIYGQNYANERTNQVRAATLAPAFTADAGSAPFSAFTNFANLTKIPGSQTTTPYFTNPTAGALSGALAGYGLSKAFG